MSAQSDLKTAWKDMNFKGMVQVAFYNEAAANEVANVFNFMQGVGGQHMSQKECALVIANTPDPYPSLCHFTDVPWIKPVQITAFQLSLDVVTAPLKSYLDEAHIVAGWDVVEGYSPSKGFAHFERSLDARCVDQTPFINSQLFNQPSISAVEANMTKEDELAQAWRKLDLHCMVQLALEPSVCPSHAFNTLKNNGGQQLTEKERQLVAYFAEPSPPSNRFSQLQWPKDVNLVAFQMPSKSNHKAVIAKIATLYARDPAVVGYEVASNYIYGVGLNEVNQVIAESYKFKPAVQPQWLFASI